MLRKDSSCYFTLIEMNFKQQLQEVKKMMRKTVQKLPTAPPISSTTDVADLPGSQGQQVITMPANALINSLHGHVIVDMDERACSEALVDLEAYYKV